MDDEVDDNGLGGLAWYALGRMSAQTDHVRSEAVDTVLSAFQRPALTINDLALQNRALRSENERLRRDLEAYQHNYQRLREWADKVEPILERQRTKRD